MPLNQIILYVENIQQTVSLYTDLLDCSPKELHPSYASFQLESGYTLAFWDIKEVKPEATGSNRALELVFQLPTKQAVNQCFVNWQQKLTIAQKPQTLDFGYTFTALDNNNNRLRVYASHE